MREEAMIRHRQQYLEFIRQQGVGERDLVADSRKSYVSYSDSVSEELGIEIGPHTTGTYADVDHLLSELEGRRAKKTISNYRSVLRQYVKMVESLGVL